jgi:hypothetical protein
VTPDPSGLSVELRMADPEEEMWFPSHGVGAYALCSTAADVASAPLFVASVAYTIPPMP